MFYYIFLETGNYWSCQNCCKMMFNPPHPHAHTDLNKQYDRLLCFSRLHIFAIYWPKPRISERGLLVACGTFSLRSHGTTRLGKGSFPQTLNMDRVASLFISRQLQTHSSAPWWWTTVWFSTQRSFTSGDRIKTVSVQIRRCCRCVFKITGLILSPNHSLRCQAELWTFCHFFFLSAICICHGFCRVSLSAVSDTASTTPVTCPWPVKAPADSFFFPTVKYWFSQSNIHFLKNIPKYIQM